MKLADLLKMVQDSSSEDWHKMDSPTVYGWNWGTNSNGNMIEPKTFETLLVYREDVDVSIAMAATVNAEFDEQWLGKFPDTSAHSVVVALRYRAAVVYEWTCVIVDGGRYLMPMPDASETAGEYEVMKDKLPMARLLFKLYGAGGSHTDLDSALKRAGIRIV